MFARIYCLFDHEVRSSELKCLPTRTNSQRKDRMEKSFHSPGELRHIRFDGNNSLAALWAYVPEKDLRAKSVCWQRKADDFD